MQNDDSDDEIATARNMKALEKEFDSGAPRKDAFLSLMKQTFSARRERILSDCSDVSFSSILAEFQAFSLHYVVSSLSTRHQSLMCYLLFFVCSFYQLAQEIDLILGKKEVFKGAIHQWTTKWVPAINSYGDSLTRKCARYHWDETKKKYNGKSIQ